MTTYLPRTAWTQVPAAGDAMPPRPVGIAVHWPGTTSVIGATSQANMAARLEGYRRYHVNGNGWADIAYQVGVDQGGRVWDLRGIGRMSAANGDQAVNRAWLACLFLLGPGESPGPALLTAFTDWRRDKALNRYPTATRIVGHRDIRPTGATECPGPITEALIKSGRLLVAGAPTSAPKDWFDMATQQDLVDAVSGLLATDVGGSGVNLGVMVQRIYNAVTSPDALASLIASKVSVAQPAVSQDVVKQAVKDALREGVQN